ncbi:hypothetical protein VTK73DRAFT_745 [Phialemonium thermophilum]|uniref:Uncharacterized protein n=1 Tax=Phialemonium thermophilum TaxID=223376 RepID=A0ABR3VUC9_9PEZI
MLLRIQAAGPVRSRHDGLFLGEHSMYGSGGASHSRAGRLAGQRSRFAGIWPRLSRPTHRYRLAHSVTVFLPLLPYAKGVLVAGLDALRSSMVQAAVSEPILRNRYLDSTGPRTGNRTSGLISRKSKRGGRITGPGLRSEVHHKTQVSSAGLLHLSTPLYRYMAFSRKHPHVLGCTFARR